MICLSLAELDASCCWLAAPLDVVLEEVQRCCCWLAVPLDVHLLAVALEAQCSLEARRCCLPAAVLEFRL